MTAVSDLDAMLAGIEPALSDTEYAVVSIPGARYGDLAGLRPLACFQEAEGLTLVLDAQIAVDAGFDVEERFRLISLAVHSSLLAVGLTAAVSQRLAEQGIPANLWAAHFHDHILVPSAGAEAALHALQKPWS